MSRFDQWLRCKKSGSDATWGLWFSQPVVGPQRCQCPHCRRPTDMVEGVERLATVKVPEWTSDDVEMAT
jgi:hypothetical protein